ncbi:acyl-CoA dehydrogenase C-terminal domain-containing protein [Acidisphaera rubrifaciens]|uniref:3-methylmercaptopropionyl-CoA dehydrogenase n=1 Tax=Acidisphaera rubrifaciens HS-AP3 TaxID=1231350 RepID=A0A0D6P9F5_9PROT|nr:acyl-CoA dehydrogenase C-terminal domain-containing protein [Acidisphaera rubrifaciens]GAN77828.1 acyl-CoA dehydrogenase [Acidisphaera rubrifaciens HS-AP3]
MQVYKAPLRDMRFVLHELNDSAGLAALDGMQDVTPELIDSVLEEAAKIAEEVLLPLNASGDEEGCHLDNGVVRTPKGFREAYRTFREGGWTGIGCAPEYGGQGLPHSVSMMVSEMLCATNMAFSMYPGLSHGAYEALSQHGSDAQKALYLPKLTDGTWTGTMCLTEPHCGTDLGLLRTRAVPADDGSYRISGTKIFISAGEHDLSENIVHLVLARIAGAPAGVRGISLFVVPKFIPTEDGRPGPRNGVVCASLEHKMGIKANATAQLVFEDAQGWIVGEPGRGLNAMFTMMNAARLGVGIQGLGMGEIAYQSAVAYARDRIQGRSLAGAKAADRAADPIIVHPDVRRMLLTIRAYNEGCRALGGWVSRRLDEAHHANDPAEREAAEGFAALMTPIVKALFTDLGLESANTAMQVYGGHGYIRDHGMEQLVRDARIALIYEGTNGIQALDLVGRKLPAHMGRNLRTFFHPVAAFIEANEKHPMLSKMVTGLGRAFGALQLATAHIASKGMGDPEEAGAAATEYLRLFGLVALGYMWARTAKLSLEKMMSAGADAAFYQTKLQTARFYFERILPQAGGLLFQIKAGKEAMMSFPEAAF